MQYKLSVIIPSRNEEWLVKTIEDLLKNKSDETEIVAILDGWRPDPMIPDHEDVRIIYLPESVGQRAAQNLGVKISRAKYVAKVDAHCSFDEGFDVEMLKAFEESGDNVVMVPVMRNLHVFDWVCTTCGMRIYQGPDPISCRNETCNFDKYGVNVKSNFKKEIMWIPKTNPQSSAYRFNKNLQFKYFPELRARQEKSGLVETMSLQGSFFMCTRENYWKYELCDESWGSWGQQGTETSVKTWLSGGRVLCNRDTWYAHLFRTQQGFSHPYSGVGKSQQNAREISRDIFLNNKWPLQKYPLSWLLEKFWFALKKVGDPEAKWTEQDIIDLKKKEGKQFIKFEQKSGEASRGIVFYTDNQLNLKIAHAVQKQLRNIAEEKNIQIVSSSLKPMTFGDKNVVVKGERGYLTYFRQIVAALEASTADIVYFCEHDVLYHSSHFDFMPKDKNKFYYNYNVWRVRSDGFAVTWDANQVAEFCCYRELALEFYKNKLKEFEADPEHFDRRFEPGGRDKNKYEVWKSKYPNIDIRHGGNLTKSKWSIKDFRDKSTCVNWREGNIKDIEGWNLVEYMEKMKLG